MVVAKKRAAAVHALFLVRVGRINLPRSHLIRGCAPARRADVHQLLNSRSRTLLVLYQSEVLSLPHRSKRIGLPLLHSDGRVPRMRVLTIWRNHRGDDVLAGRQIAIVILTFAQVRHFGPSTETE